MQISNILMAILKALSESCNKTSLSISIDLITDFDDICSKIRFPSNYPLMAKPLFRKSYLKCAEKICLCSELLVYLVRMIYDDCEDISNLCSLILCLNELCCGSHTIDSLSNLEHRLAECITILQIANEDDPLFGGINFHLVMHLPQQIRLFGPISGWWSMIFERKGYELKQMIHTGKNAEVRELIILFISL